MPLTRAGSRRRAGPRATGAAKSVEKALDILCCFGQEPGELSASRLSQLLGYNRTTVHRLLRALEQRRMVSKNPQTRAYSVGLKIRELAALDLWYGELRYKALPLLRGLRDLTGETAGVYVLTPQRELVCIEKVESHSELKQAPHVGSPLPFGRGASSKVLLLSFLEKGDQELRRVVQELPEENRPTDSEAFLRELRQLQEQGYAFSESNIIRGATGLSAPIRYKGTIIAALTVSGPSSRFGAQTAEKFLPALLDAATQLSNTLSVESSTPPA